MNSSAPTPEYGAPWLPVTTQSTNTRPPVYVLVHPDGRAGWGDRIGIAEDELGPHGIGRAFLNDDARLRVATSDCALVLRDVYAPNPYAAAVLARVAGFPVEAAPETRGPVVLFGFDPRNEWDSTRPPSNDERRLITEALGVAEYTVGS
ncbi:hypothetical protein [Streptomyces sp. NBC_00057]|uniref:hypothetical protein n=1 Tax=Streptomyces sp. NBC_00057 TaxID=2975634 RepID=UPI00324B62D8